MMKSLLQVQHQVTWVFKRWHWPMPLWLGLHLLTKVSEVLGLLPQKLRSLQVQRLWEWKNHPNLLTVALLHAKWPLWTSSVPSAHLQDTNGTGGNHSHSDNLALSKTMHKGYNQQDASRNPTMATSWCCQPVKRVLMTSPVRCLALEEDLPPYP